MKDFVDKEFDAFLKAKEDGIVMFSAPWCNACKAVSPLVEKVSENYSDFNFAKVDVSVSPAIASRMGVMSLPNILIFKKGKVVDQIIGTTTEKSLESKIKKLV